MKTFFTADTHFGHVNMTREGKDLCGRPFDTVDEMNQALLDGINSTVSSKERLVILGDVVMGKLETNIHLLAEIRAAEVVFVPGNHDRWSPAYHHKGADAEAKREEWRLRFAAAHHNAVALPGTDTMHQLDGTVTVEPVRFWDFCQLSDGWFEHPLDGALFSHFPYTGDHTSDDRYADLRALDSGGPIIHGHVHDSWRIKDRQFNVGVDVNDFKPVSEDELADWVRSL